MTRFNTKASFFLSFKDVLFYMYGAGCVWYVCITRSVILCRWDWVCGEYVPPVVDWCPGTEDFIKSSGTGVTGICKHCIGTGNWTAVLCSTVAAHILNQSPGLSWTASAAGQTCCCCPSENLKGFEVHGRKPGQRLTWHCMFIIQAARETGARQSRVQNQTQLQSKTLSQETFL